MSRKGKRDGIRTALVGLGTFAAVYKGARRRFGGLSPVATVLSRGEESHFDTRGATAPDWQTFSYILQLFVRADEGAEEAAEDLLDDVREAIGPALMAIGCVLGESDAEPLGFALRNIDGVLYRVERVPLHIEEYI
jgi:hypothetical protein